MEATLQSAGLPVQLTPGLANRAIAERADQALLEAAAVYSQRPGWVVFFREILGRGGAVQRLFPTPAEFAAFGRTAEREQIDRMLDLLRKRDSRRFQAAERSEGQRVITVRLPRELHESLLAQAKERNTSLNQLCIGRLLQDEAIEV